LAVALLILTTGALFVAPLVPALRELYFPSDSQPLTVVQQYAGEIRYFADSFRNYISVLQESLAKAAHADSVIRGVLPDGVHYLVMGSGDSLVLEKNSDGICPCLIATAVDLIVPSNTGFSQDIYAARNFLGGQGNQYRAILGEKNIELGVSSAVARWVHAGGTFIGNENCDLHGRVSSDAAILLHRGCAFQRLNAPQIQLGNLTSQIWLPPTGTGRIPEPAARRLLIEGDYDITPGAVIVGNVCVRGNLRVGTGARVVGSVKSGARLTLEPCASIEGSLVSMQELHIGKGCSINGPIIAERHLVIGSDTRCGDLTRPTTVTATRMEVAEGTVVFGSLWAREFGVVVAP
jgi:cytoskeletal protein CcmA (bactofilin family)